MPRLLLVGAFSVLSGAAVFGPALLAPPSPPTSGLLMGSPLGWTTELTPPIQAKPPGFTPAPPPTPPPGVPVVDFAGFVPWLVADQKYWVSPLLAMSLGIDVITTTEVTVTPGNVEPPDPTWRASRIAARSISSRMCSTRIASSTVATRSTPPCVRTARRWRA